MIAILTAAYEMGGVTGWAVLAALAGVPALTFIGCLALVLHRPKPPIRRPGKFSR